MGTYAWNIIYSKIFPAKSCARRHWPVAQAAPSQVVHRNLATGNYKKKKKKRLRKTRVKPSHFIYIVIHCMSSNVFMETHCYWPAFISHRPTPVTSPVTRSSNDFALIVAHVGRNCIGVKSFYVTAPLFGMPSLETSGRQNHCPCSKRYWSLTFIQNSDLLCVYICIVCHHCALI